MVEVITVTKFGEIFSQLEKRFRKITGDQQGIYYDRLKYYPEDVLSKAVEHLVDNAVHMPSPGEIRAQCREAERNIRQSKIDRSQPISRPSCSKCRNGYVRYKYQFMRRDGSLIWKIDVRPCAVCNTESDPHPHHIQIQDVIYFSAKRYGDRWIPDLTCREETDFIPVTTSKDLEEYFRQEKTGKVVPTEVPEFPNFKRVPIASPIDNFNPADCPF